MKPNFAVMANEYQKLPMHPDGDFPSCAIRMSMVLSKVGLYDSSKYRKSGNKVSSHGWALRAEELYQYLRLNTSLGNPQMLHVSESETEGRYVGLPGERGLVYLRNCWYRDSDTGKPNGDHIDLYFFQGGNAWLMTAYRWPAHCGNSILVSCNDGIVRYWPCS